jgi:hypothetical protein
VLLLRTLCDPFSQGYMRGPKGTSFFMLNN